MMINYFIISLLSLVSSEFIIEDDIQYELLWNNPAKVGQCIDHLFVISKDKDNCTCYLKDNDINNSANVSHSEILAKFTKLFSSYIIDEPVIYQEHYWTYELRHGSEIKQYHVNTQETSKSQAKQEYYLGHFDANNLNESVNKGDFQVVKTYYLNKRYTGVAVKYEDGSLCNLIPDCSRSSQVIYICDPSMHERIVSVAEVATCAYEILFVSYRICDIPGLDRLSKTRTIYCSASNGTDVIPREIQSLHKKQLHSGSGLNRNFVKITTIDGEKVVVKLFLKNVNNENINMNNLLNTEIDENQDSIEYNGGENTVSAANLLTPNGSNIEEYRKSAMLRSFFDGNCIHGKSDQFWNYEFCFNKYLMHFHKYMDSTEDWNITLGIWNPKNHIEWYQDNIESISTDKNVIATMLYTDGSICEEINQARMSKIKLICYQDINATKDDDIIFSSLKEDEHCIYTFNIRSSLFCDSSIKLDSNGMPSLDNTTD
ncbi:hypothetical protein GJ496_002300 [Pomphorhynchus laevis]|nr:hypothetical protein GJ496_002300 [Pomphorhynchus laevis]